MNWSFNLMCILWDTLDMVWHFVDFTKIKFLQDNSDSIASQWEMNLTIKKMFVFLSKLHLIRGTQRRNFNFVHFSFFKNINSSICQWDACQLNHKCIYLSLLLFYYSSLCKRWRWRCKETNVNCTKVNKSFLFNNFVIIDIRIV